MKALVPAGIVVVFSALCAFGCSSQPVQDSDDDIVASSASDLTSTQIQKTTAFLDQRALAWVDKDDWGFVQGGRCVMSCHTTAPFMLVRPKTLSNGASTTTTTTTTPVSPAALATVRGYVEARVNGWSTLAPLYSWVAPDSRGLESIMNAFALVSADAPSGALSLTAKKALGFMWAEQKADGSFPWWTTFTLAPWENPEANVWGAALAELAIGMTPASYTTNMTTAEKTKLASLESFLRGRATATATPLHNRAMILLAAAKRPTLLSATVKTQIAEAITDLQATNGSWSASSLGYTVAGGTTAGSAAHAYATAFYTYALAQNGDTSGAVTSGRAWLESHQRSDGAWEAKSLNLPTDSFNNELITDGATAYALLALTP